MTGIAIVDDHRLFREALKTMLSKNVKFDILFEASNGKELLEILKKQNSHPEIIIMDYQMPFVDGIAAAKILKVKYPSIRIIILSLFQNEHLIAELFENGVTGYVSKNIEPTELFLAIENVLDGKKYIQKSILETSSLLKKIKSGKQSCLADSFILKEHHQLFLKLLVDGLSYKEIGDAMGVSDRTAHHYRDQLFEQLQMNSRNDLVVYAIQRGIVDVINNTERN